MTLAELQGSVVLVAELQHLRQKTYAGAYGCSHDASLCSTVARPLQCTANYFDTIGHGDLR